MTKNEFKAWVDEMYQIFCNSNRYGYQKYKRKIVVVDCKTGKVATAKCHKDDKFDTDTGIAIALAKLKGWEVPEIDEIVLHKLKWGDTFFTAGIHGGAIRETANEYNSYEINAFISERAAKAACAKLKTVILLERIHEAVCPDYGLDWNKMRSELEIGKLNRVTSEFPHTIIRRNGKWEAVLATWHSPVETAFPPDVVEKVVNYLNQNYSCF